MKIPETLTELEKHIKKVKSAKEVFGDDPKHVYRTFCRISHPDRNPGDKKAETLFKKIQELYDSLEVKPVVIKSPKKSYTISRLIAAGDIADLHLAQAETDGVLHDYVLKISRVVNTHKMLENEQKIIADLLTKAGDTTYRKYFPTLVESFPAYDKIQKRVNVFTVEDGPIYTAEEIHEKLPALDGRHLAWMFKRLLTGLGFVHQAGYVHGAVLPCHVRFNIKNHGGQLTSWGHAVKIGETITTVSKKYKEWYPPEVLKKQAATPATDIYMLAKTVLYLAGVNPNAPFKLNEKLVPLKEQRYLQSCLLESPKMRPGDAWSLLDEFTEMLKQVYGKPKFAELTLPD